MQIIEELLNPDDFKSRQELYLKDFQREAGLSEQQSDSELNTVHYIRLCAHQDQVIQALKKQKEKLEKEKAAITKSLQAQASTSRMYLGQYDKLTTNQKALTGEVDRTLLLNKDLSDENGLLKSQIEVLTKQIKLLKTIIKQKRIESQSFKEERLKLVREKKELLSENEMLRNELAALSSNLRFKKSELNQLKSGINTMYSVLEGYRTELEKFSSTALANENQISLLTVTIQEMINNIDSHVKATVSVHIQPKASFF